MTCFAHENGADGRAYLARICAYLRVSGLLAVAKYLQIRPQKTVFGFFGEARYGEIRADTRRYA